MPPSSVTLWLLLAGCIETGLDRDHRGDPLRDEACNGRDDDGDGQVDEGFPDGDGDGIADCIDLGCDLQLREGGAVQVDPTCITSEVLVEDPWDVQVEWQDFGESKSVIMTPLVGTMTDDDGDGDVDLDDVPDIVVVTYAGDLRNGRLRVFSGDGSGMHWERDGWDASTGIALADLDGDGASDVVGFAFPTRGPIAVRADGTLLWRADRGARGETPHVTVADLDGDGSPEVIADHLVLEGRTGALELDLPIDPDIRVRMPAVADLDGDGTQEIVIGDQAFSATGDPLWRSPVRGDFGHWTAIFDADGDPQAEVAMIGGGRLVVHEHDGTILHDREVEGRRPGPPCVADFDGDGMAEIAWGAARVLRMVEHDGTTAWTRPIWDSSGMASCSGFDLDGDGSDELLFADHDSFYILDGATGDALYTTSAHTSRTSREYPSVADIDQDGSAEVILASNASTGPYRGLTVLGHAGAGWTGAGPTWHTHDFTVTTVLADGSVPPSPEPWWLTHNGYRSRPAILERPVTDLQVQATDLCVSDCLPGGVARLAIQLGNVGLIDSGPEVPFQVHRVDGDTRTPIHVGRLPRVETGQVMPTTVIELPVDDILGADALLVEVDGQGWGLHAECDEDDNTHLWVEMPCP